MAQLGAFVDRWSAFHLPTPPGRLVVPGPLRAFFLAGMARASEVPVLAVVPGDQDAEGYRHKETGGQPGRPVSGDKPGFSRIRVHVHHSYA